MTPKANGVCSVQVYRRILFAKCDDFVCLGCSRMGANRSKSEAKRDEKTRIRSRQERPIVGQIERERKVKRKIEIKSSLWFSDRQIAKCVYLQFWRKRVSHFKQIAQTMRGLVERFKCKAEKHYFFAFRLAHTHWHFMWAQFRAKYLRFISHSWCAVKRS